MQLCSSFVSPSHTWTPIESPWVLPKLTNKHEPCTKHERSTNKTKGRITNKWLHSNPGGLKCWEYIGHN